MIADVRSFLPDKAKKISVTISYPKWDEIDFDFKLYDDKNNILETIYKSEYTNENITTIDVKEDFNEEDRIKYNEYCVSDYIHNQFYNLLNESLYTDTYYYCFD